MNRSRYRLSKRWLALPAGLTVLVAGCLIVVAGNLPDFGTTGLGDAWSFDVQLNGEVTLSAVSNQADLVLELYDASGNFLDAGDDEIACDGATLPCGFLCPEIRRDLSPGTYFVVVRDFGTTSPDCGGGEYILTIHTPGSDLPGDATQVLDDQPVMPSRSTLSK